MKAIEMFQHVNDLRDRFFSTYENLTQDQLDWKLDGYKNNLGFFLRHIAQSEDWLLRAIIFSEEMVPKRKVELPTITEIIDYLREARVHTLEFLENHDVAILNESRVKKLGTQTEDTTVGWVIHRIFDHEVYHLAQANLFIRLQGGEPPSM